MSECDNEKLIATRKLHRLDDNLFKESDKNVAIKESIEIVKKFNKENRYRDCGRVNNAIDTLIFVAENSIPVQKIEDKIDENKEYRKYANTAFEYTQQEVHDEIVKAFEELLEEK